MSKHPIGCSCKKCRAARKAKFPNGCMVCFVRPRLPDVRHCADCDEASRKRHAEAMARARRESHADDLTLRRERITAGASIASNARMLGHA